MTVSELKEELRQLTKYYFTGAEVSFSKQSFTAKPKTPFISLTMGVISRPINPPTIIIDGRPVAVYPASTAIQIDLFTNGKQMEVAKGFTPIVENTAEEDLLEFASFLNSEYVIQWCHQRDLAIVVPNTVQDLTGLINDTNYEFRAMMEVTVYFTMTAIGYTATLLPTSVKHTGIDSDGQPYEYEGGDIQADDVTELIPAFDVTPSGGGNKELVDEEDGYFTNVEINDRPVKEENEQ